MHTEIFCYVLLQLCMPLEIVLSNMLYIHWTLDEWLIRVACLVQVTSDGVAYLYRIISNISPGLVFSNPSEPGLLLETGLV